jgi:hypothetical protein
MPQGGVYPEPRVARLVEINWAEAAPVQNTWYTVLRTTNAELVSLAIGPVGANETVHFRATVDGEVFLGDATAVVDGQWTTPTSVRITGIPNATVNMSASSAAKDIDFGSNNPYPLLSGKSLLIEMRKTTALAGTLAAIGYYKKW